MGNLIDSCLRCFGKSPEASSTNHTDRTNLVDNDLLSAQGGTADPALVGGISNDGVDVHSVIVGPHAPGAGTRNDEQALLNSILQNTASNVIDVAALDTHIIEQQEYMERARQYSQRLNANASTLRRAVKKRAVMKELPDLLGSINRAEPLTEAENEQLQKWSQQVSDAYRSMKIKAASDLVVHFGPAVA